MPRINTGGPAFPGNENYIDGHPTSREGMNLRDYFAGQAIGAVIIQRAADFRSQDGLTVTQYFAKQAFEVADALVAESIRADKANAKAREEEFGDDLPF